MALNKFMHPRNIYKSPPDFEKLANLNKEFSEICKKDLAGKVYIDFKDANSLRILTKCLLKTDFDLDVKIPENRLVPTLPLRLNYILWLEDLMSAIKRTNKIKGLDIGTGACAIYPLLAAKKNKWIMMGTETDSESFLTAKENVQRNHLQKLITLKKNTNDTIIKHVFTDTKNQTFDFCMCNPPFYSSVEELWESRSPARLPPKNGFTGSAQELITKGGELSFCKQLIKESIVHPNEIEIYTTMIGHKYNLKELLQVLESLNIKHTHTEFCQGRVTRWGLAWTFNDYILHKLVPPRDHIRKKQKPAVFILPKLPNCTYNVDVAFKKIMDIFSSLNINCKTLEKMGKKIVIEIVANSNTWSHQRRKRRIQKRQEEQIKKIKLSLAEDELHHQCDTNTSTTASDEQETGSELLVNETETVVHAFAKLFKTKQDNILLEMEFLDGCAGKEGMHQIVQYIKNNWK